jgi:hypothetical protein
VYFDLSFSDIKTGLLIYDGNKQTLWIHLGRGKADDL